MEKLNYSQNELKWVRDLNVKATWTHLEKINVTYSIIKIHYIRHFTTAASETTITSKMSPKLQSCCSRYIFIKMKSRFGSRRKHLQSLSVAKE